METMETDRLSSSDDSNSEDEEEEQRLLERVEQLERQISDNKYLYDVHIEIVNLYRQLGDLKSLRLAYERFHEYFPLTPKLWLDWISVEKKLATSDNEIKNVLNLFEKAVDDYLSVELWQEYAQYSIGACDIKTTREIFEKALTAAGLHTNEGSLLWDTLREFELAHLSLLKTDCDEFQEQLKCLIEIFRRQLSVPLIGMENTYKEWQIWLENLSESDRNKIDPKPIEWGYQNALKLLEIYKPYEDKLLKTNDEQELYEIYKDYIKHVQDPSTVFCLYERAVANLCLNPYLWIDYCSFALKFDNKADKISQRALRNCPWSEDLWMMRLKVLEYLKMDSDEILKCFEIGMSNMGKNQGADLWLSYLEYIKRTSDDKDKLYKLFEQAIEQIGYRDDANLKIIQWYIKILAKNGDMVTVRKLWKNILKNPQNRSLTNVWLEFINIEEHYGDKNQCRNLFQRALNNCTDWQQFLIEKWLMFEREYGTLDDMLKCMEKCREFSKNFQNTQQIQQVPIEENKGIKRKIVDDNKDDMKKPKFEKLLKQKVVKDPTKTVFISNLYPSINEKRLKKFFPNAINIELVVDRQGKSRCYGYVQFSIEEEVMSALARDRELLDGRPIFISRCKPDKNERKQSFKYSLEPENNKLFVRGLPLNKTKEDIEVIFKPYGCTDVRLVLQKSGQPKGLAYVEFPDEASAKKAIEMTDQMKIDEHTITVAVSAPPPKSQAKLNPTSSNTVATTTTTTRHSKSRLQVPLIPRSLQIKSDKSTANGNADGNAKQQPKSNEDFRKMLLK